MSASTQPRLKSDLKDVVLVGAGHAHVGVLRTFGLAPVPGVRLTVITRQVDTAYSGMLPGTIAGLYRAEETHIDTRPLARFAGARLLIADVMGLDLDNKRVLCRDCPPVPYDVLSLNIGSTPGMRGVPGADTYAIPVKPIDGFLQRFALARGRVLAARGAARVGVVGAGAGGVELILSLHHRLTKEVRAAGFDPQLLSFALLGAGPEVLPSLPLKMRRRFTEVLRERGIAFHANARVAKITAAGAVCSQGQTVPLDEIFWATRAAAAPWLAETGLALDADGFVRVSATLQSVSQESVFASGDVSTFEGRHLPRSGVYAVRSGPPLANNIRRLIAGRSLIRHDPQHHALSLISTGGKYAIGTRNGLVFEGAYVWRVKDWIDRRFMAQFKNLPDQ